MEDLKLARKANHGPVLKMSTFQKRNLHTSAQHEDLLATQSNRTVGLIGRNSLVNWLLGLNDCIQRLL